MHALDHIVRLNSPERRQPHPLRLHPRIFELRQRIRGMAVSSEYVARLYDSLYKYADQLIARPQYQPDEGWDDFEALQQITLEDWSMMLIRSYEASSPSELEINRSKR